MTQSHNPGMKLEGIRVVDLSRFLPGPVLTQFMADHGADVIKIESVDEGEPTRAIGEKRDGVSVFFANTNRGKRSVALDLKMPDAVEVVMRLIETADVFVESFRPGVVDRLGLGYSDVSKRAPHIVYASISAFGQSGPYRDLAAHDLAIEAMSGVLSITRGQDGKVAMPGMPAADMMSALVGLSAVLMALLRRKETGRGDYVDIAMADCLLPGMLNNFGIGMSSRRQPGPMDSRSLGGNALYALYETEDGSCIALGGQEPKFTANLFNALGRPDLIGLAGLPPGPQQDPLREFLRETFRTKTRDEWVAFFEGHDAAFAPVRTLPEVLDDAHFRHRGMVVTDARGWDHIGNPIHFFAEPARIDWNSAALGQDTRPVMRAVGYPDSEIAKLVNAGAAKEATPQDALCLTDTKTLPVA
jgi:crotonobetainyl-CoA:carnitine CoA-transferase CaiB-like acyl-CoA transferase